MNDRAGTKFLSDAKSILDDSQSTDDLKAAQVHALLSIAASLSSIDLTLSMIHNGDQAERELGVSHD